MFKNHKPNCSCCVCKSRRGEYFGKNASNYKDGRTFKKYFCKECGKKISMITALYGGGRCPNCSSREIANRPDVKEKHRKAQIGNQNAKGHKQTEKHKNKIRIANSGENSSSYKDGRTLRKYYCIDCGKRISSYFHKRCAHCNSKFLWQDFKYRGKNKTNLGNKHTQKTKNKMKNTLHRHHVYLDGNDNNKILMLTSSKHRQLHTRAYNYLVEINKIDDYIKWFDKKYNLYKKKGEKI